MNTSRMLLDPTIPDEDVLESVVIDSLFGGLERLNKNLRPKIDDVPLLKYIALMYDKNSPLQNFNISRRKQEALNMSELIMNVEDVLGMKNKKAIFYASAYLRFQKDKIWASLKTNEEVFWQCQEALISNNDDLSDLKKKGELQDAMDKSLERGKKYEAELLGDNLQAKDEIINFDVEDYVRLLMEAQNGQK